MTEGGGMSTDAIVVRVDIGPRCNARVHPIVKWNCLVTVHVVHTLVPLANAARDQRYSVATMLMLASRTNRN
jgi:hypothetical protein